VPKLETAVNINIQRARTDFLMRKLVYPIYYIRNVFGGTLFDCLQVILTMFLLFSCVQTNAGREA